MTLKFVSRRDKNDFLNPLFDQFQKSSHFFTSMQFVGRKKSDPIIMMKFCGTILDFDIRR